MTPQPETDCGGQRGGEIAESEEDPPRTQKVFGNAGLDSDLNELTSREYLASDR